MAKPESKRPVQTFTSEYLTQTRKLTPEQVLVFLSDFQTLHSQHEGKRILISLRVPQNLLEAFKLKSKLNGIAYQTNIVCLMRTWLAKGSPKS